MGMSIAQPGYVKYLREQEIPQVCQELLTKCAGAPIDLVYCILPQGEFRSIFFVFGQWTARRRDFSDIGRHVEGTCLTLDDT